MFIKTKMPKQKDVDECNGTAGIGSANNLSATEDEVRAFKIKLGHFAMNKHVHYTVDDINYKFIGHNNRRTDSCATKTKIMK